MAKVCLLLKFNVIIVSNEIIIKITILRKEHYHNSTAINKVINKALDLELTLGELVKLVNLGPSTGSQQRTIPKGKCMH